MSPLGAARGSSTAVCTCDGSFSDVASGRRLGIKGPGCCYWGTLLRALERFLSRVEALPALELEGKAVRQGGGAIALPNRQKVTSNCYTKAQTPTPVLASLVRYSVRIGGILRMDVLPTMMSTVLTSRRHTDSWTYGWA